MGYLTFNEEKITNSKEKKRKEKKRKKE